MPTPHAFLTSSSADQAWAALERKDGNAEGAREIFRRGNSNCPRCVSLTASLHIVVN